MRTALVLAVALSSSPALADNKPAPAAQPAGEKTPDLHKLEGSECAKARKENKTCVISIENEDIVGENATGDGTGYTALEFPNLGSLIRLRLHFLPEIVRSTEDL